MSEWIGLGAGEVGVEFGEHQLGDRQAERAGDLAGHQLGDQRLGTVTGAPELHDIRAVVVGFDDRRERAAFAQRRDVACDPNRAQCRHQRHCGMTVRVCSDRPCVA